MSNNVQSDNNLDDLKELIEKNIQVSKDIHEIALHVKKYIFWQKIFGILKFFIIIVPIILSIIYLPPLLRQVFEQYKTILDLGASVNNVPEVPSGIINFLK